MTTPPINVKLSGEEGKKDHTAAKYDYRYLIGALVMFSGALVAHILEI